MAGSTPVWYVALWGSACLLALLLAIRYYRDLVPWRDYFRFLFRPWKSVTFLIAVTAFVLAAPYSGDPTWDTANSILISCLTYLTAPWAIGVLYQVITRKRPWYHAYIAVCVMIFSACWSYDLYILLRDGQYPPTWLSNLPLSLSLYIAAGLFWNLIWTPKKGIKFAFQQQDWLSPSETPQFLKLWPIALLMMAFVALLVALFLWDHLLR